MASDNARQVASRINIVDLISEYVPLKKAGKDFKACCPFHSEKTPSFFVSPEKQIFHCFGCQEGGDVFTFVMKHDRLSFPEALRYLADRYGIVLEAQTAASAKADSLAKEMKEQYRLAAAFYHELLLKSKEAEEARAYLAKRGYSAKTAEIFQLGWAGTDSQALFKMLSKRGFSNESLLDSGLFRQGTQAPITDLFRSRLLFPICNSRGEVIAFGGRLLHDGLPKYLNSPETRFFKKREELYGLHLAKGAIAKTGYAIVVEGYFDFIRLYERGFQQTVATLGTALTEGHARALKRYTEEIIVLFDTDDAGVAAALRGIELMLGEGFYVKVLSLPGSKDPDAYLNENSTVSFESLLRDHAEDFFDFKLKRLLKQGDASNPQELGRIAVSMLELLEKIENQVILEKYMQRLSRRLNVSEATLRAELAKRGKKSSPVLKEVSQKNKELPTKLFDGIEVSLLRIMLHLPRQISKVKAAGITPESFKQEVVREVIQYLWLLPEDTSTLDGSFVSELSEKAGQLVRQLLFKDLALESPEVFCQARIREMLLRAKESEKEILKEKIQSGARNGQSPEQLQQDYARFMNLKKEIAELKAPVMEIDRISGDAKMQPTSTP